MRNKTQSKACLALICAMGISACSDHKRLEPNRYVKDVAAISATHSEPLKALTDSLDPESIPLACERLEQLSVEHQASNAASFSYIGKVFANRGQFSGMINIEESPFTQFVIGEKFKVDNFDDFYEKAKQEYEAGKVSGMKWFLLNTMKKLGMGKKAQFSATNGKLEEKFPGIFGEASTLENSMYLQLAKRIAKIESIEEKVVASLLSKKLALFPGDTGWASHASATGISLAAAKKGMSSEDSKERLCSLVLLHQNFAQLLRVKGHRAPVHQPSRGPVSSKLEKLSASNPEFPVSVITGAFFDLNEKKSILLENESISEYNPQKQLLSVGSKVPTGESGELGTLADSLSFMEAMLFSFEASSPAADGVTDATYLFGDVAAETGTAVLPAEAHSLSLGLFTMQMKNLAGLHIKKLNAKGQSVKEGEMAAGIALISEAGVGLAQGKVKLAELVRLARITSYFENALKRLTKLSPERLEKLNPVYRKATLAALLGRAMFSEEELSSLLTEEQRKTVLRDSLVALKLPLAVLMSQMGTGKQGCVAEIQWNLETGERKPLAACNKELKLELADAFEIMARDSNSPLLLQKAEELRR